MKKYHSKAHEYCIFRNDKEFSLLFEVGRDRKLCHVMSVVQSFIHDTIVTYHELSFKECQRMALHYQ